MGNFIKCSNCAKEGLTVPMQSEGHELVCALCGIIKTVTESS